jgi:hypothetical protein
MVSFAHVVVVSVSQREGSEVRLHIYTLRVVCGAEAANSGDCMVSVSQ